MPTYNYRCTKCEKIFDAFHSMMCTDPQHCPECGAAANKLLSASSVIFKGSGFYSTDYRDSGYLEAKKKDGSNGSAPKTETSNDGASKADATTPGQSTGKTEDSSPVSKPAASPATPSTPVIPSKPSTPTAQAA